mmetsp:Transcript_84649/g.220535  ORF Transcript_84649/g.220535 Transcript_84649/m.220535 type:complete len:249 (+) Transcript_84649:1527-2273(+)
MQRMCAQHAREPEEGVHGEVTAGHDLEPQLRQAAMRRQDHPAVVVADAQQGPDNSVPQDDPERGQHTETVECGEGHLGVLGALPREACQIPRQGPRLQKRQGRAFQCSCRLRTEGLPLTPPFDAGGVTAGAGRGLPMMLKSGAYNGQAQDANEDHQSCDLSGGPGEGWQRVVRTVARRFEVLQPECLDGFSSIIMDRGIGARAGPAEAHQCTQLERPLFDRTLDQTILHVSTIDAALEIAEVREGRKS